MIREIISKFIVSEIMFFSCHARQNLHTYNTNTRIRLSFESYRKQDKQFCSILITASVFRVANELFHLSSGRKSNKWRRLNSLRRLCIELTKLRHRISETRTCFHWFWKRERPTTFLFLFLFLFSSSSFFLFFSFLFSSPFRNAEQPVLFHTCSVCLPILAASHTRDKASDILEQCAGRCCFRPGK